VKAGAISAYSYTEQDVGKATGTVVARVIKGERAGTITVQIPTDYKLSINLTSAQAMGLSIPDSLRASADIVYP
jgi:putative ABC transport system substrate-binding protein